MRLNCLSCSMLALLVACGGGGGTDAGGTDGGAGDGGTPGQDGGSGFQLPAVAPACAAPAVGAAQTLTVTGTADLAAASSDSEIAFVYSDRVTDTLHAWVQRAALDGTPAGDAIDVLDLGTGFVAGVAIATDGTRYVICGSGSAALECATVPVGGGAVTPGASITGASMPALAFGAGGFMLAYQSGGGVSAQALSASAQTVGAASPVASGTGRPSIAPTESGYVVGFASSTARAQLLDAAGAPSGAPLELGSSRAMTNVAVTFTNGLVGASFIGVTGDAMAFLEGHAAVTIGLGASSYGRVSIARAANGLLASWSDFAGFVGVVALGTDGAAMGGPAMVNVSWDDNAHALAASADGFVLATTTNPSGAPIELHSLDCP